MQPYFFMFFVIKEAKESVNFHSISFALPDTLALYITTALNFVRSKTYDFHIVLTYMNVGSNE